MIVLFNADCMEILPILEDDSIDLVLCDPPYGVTACKWDSAIPLGQMWEQLNRVAHDSATVALCCMQPFTSTLISSNIGNFKYCWKWQKSNITGHANAKIMPMRDHEDIAIFKRRRGIYNPQGLIEYNKRVTHNPRKRKDPAIAGLSDSSLLKSYVQRYTNYPKMTIKIQSVTKTVHPTQKPIALMEYLILTYTDKGGTVLDFTMGSGTTGIAAKRTGRHFFGIEKNRKYFEQAQYRIELGAGAYSINIKGK